MNQNIGWFQIWQSSASLKIKFFKSLDYSLGTILAFLLPARQPKTISTTDVQNILIIRPGGMGDAVLLMPVLKQFKIQFPHIPIDILCEKRNAPYFLLQKELLTHVFCYDDFKDLKQVLAKRYDVIIDSEQWHYLSVLLGYFLRTKALIGFATRPLRRKLLDITCDYEIDSYELNNFINLMKPLRLKTEGITVEGSLTLVEDLKQWASQQLKGNYAAFLVGAGVLERRLTVEQGKDIIHSFLSGGFKVVLLGGNDGKQDADELCRLISDDRILNLVGRISLAHSAAIIHQCQCFIGADSGLLHVAVALNVPVVALFGPGNATKWAPQGQAHKIIRDPLECSPCTLYGYTISTCQGKFMCMRNLQTMDIMKAVKALSKG